VAHLPTHVNDYQIWSRQRVTDCVSQEGKWRETIRKRVNKSVNLGLS
jgi:hypothetical protein